MFIYISIFTEYNQVNQSNNNMTRELNRLLKRLFDIVAAILGLIIFAPVIIIIWILIKIEDGESAIFKQERIGYRGKPFIIYKFRSMRIDAESNDIPQLAQDEDNRLTKIGNFIRRHHLDEFPQLWNVLKGDMSFVGPRPERRFFIDEIIKINSDYELLYQIRPGLFSEATLYNGYTDTIEKMLLRLDMDLEYLEKMSLWFDFKIIFLTSFYIISGKKF